MHWHCYVGRCDLYSSLCKYLLPNKINNAAVMGLSKDYVSGHCISLVGEFGLSRQLQTAVHSLYLHLKW